MGKLYVCAVDGSKVADRAAACAVDLAKSAGAQLCFLNINVVPTRSRKTYFWDATLLAAAEAQSHAQLAAAAKVAKGAKFGNYDCVIASGSNVADAIVAYAQKQKADHVIVGTGTTNELARVFLGSVATAVVSHAPCPVTVVK
ncbi:universal stress protein [Dongia sp.]|uniref:universal stress protein n=1 Tax=Dongia sp. TaxID=1977262 RepID=UPI0037513A9A